MKNRFTSIYLLLRSIKIILILMLVPVYSVSANNLLDKCRSISKVEFSRTDLFICCRGDLFKTKPAIWEGDNLLVYKASPRGYILLRDYSVFGQYWSKIRQREKSIHISLEMAQYPDWKHKPVFTEVVNVNTGKSAVYPEFKVPSFSDKRVSKIFARLNRKDIAYKPNDEKYWEFIYSNLFELYRLGYHDPVGIAQKMAKLSDKPWNDGEVWGVYLEMIAHLKYLKGKKIIILKTRLKK